MTLQSCIALLAALVMLHVVTASKAKPMNKVKVTRVRSGKAVFDYEGLGTRGPAEWGDISPVFAFCKKGHHQTPINLMINNATADAKMPTVELYEADLSYAPSGKNFVMECKGAAGGRYCSTVRYADGVYHMLHAHFVSPSEHHIDGRDYPMELQLVHQREDGKGLLVLGIPFELGEFNDDVQKLLDGADQQNSQVVDLSRLISQNTGLCAYEGSLTTPPCSEGVQWLISNSHPTVSLKQVGLYREQVGEHTNNRPVQVPVADPKARCYHNVDVSKKTASPSDNTPISPENPQATNSTVVGNSTAAGPLIEEPIAEESTAPDENSSFLAFFADFWDYLRGYDPHAPNTGFEKFNATEEPVDFFK